MKALIFYRNLSSKYISTQYDYYFYLSELIDKPFQQSQLAWFNKYLPEFKQWHSSGPRVDHVRIVLQSLQTFLGKPILPISLATLSHYKEKLNISSFQLYLPMGEYVFNQKSYQQQGVTIISLAAPALTLINYTEYYRALLAVSFNSVFEPKTTIQLKIAQLLQYALANQSNYSFNRTLIDSAGTTGLSAYIALGCISFEQLMTYFSSLKNTELHRQLGWILYCKLKHGPVEKWDLPAMTTKEVNSLKNFIKGQLHSNVVTDWINQYSRKLLKGQTLSNRARLMLSAYLIRDLKLNWRCGQLVWRILLKDAHPLINAYNWRAQSKNRFLSAYNLLRQIQIHSKTPKYIT